VKLVSINEDAAVLAQNEDVDSVKLRRSLSTVWEPFVTTGLRLSFLWFSSLWYHITNKRA